MKRQTPVTVLDLIRALRDGVQPDGVFCVYGTGDSSGARLDSICYLDAPPEVTEDFEEVFPSFVLSRGLELWYRDELVQDVVTNALHQDPSVSNERLLQAIEYYVDRDCFMSL